MPMQKFKDIEVRNLSEFISFIQTIKDVECKGDDNQVISFKQKGVYYRGQPDIKQELRPGLFRKKDGNNIVGKEYELLQQAQRIAYYELSKCNTYTEKLIILQHYGLLTRLLDITFNPLIALYFACLDCFDKKEANGVVYCGHINDTSQDAVETVSKMAFLLKDYNTEFSLEVLRKYLPSNENESVLLKSLCMPHYVYPPLNNSRITSQNGAFLIAPFLKKDRDNNFIKIREYEFEIGNGDKLFYNNRAIIPYDKKNTILEELTEFGIDEGSIYPELDYKLRVINNNVNTSNINI